MTRRARSTLLIVGLLGSAGTGLAVYAYLDYQSDLRASIRSALPVDIDGDGRDELILHYTPPDGWTEEASLLEAVDPRTGQRLWSTMTVPTSSSGTPTRQDLVVMGSAVAVFSSPYVGEHDERHRASIASHDLRTGAQRWRRDLPTRDSHPLYWSLFLYEGKLLTSTRSNRATQVLALNPNSGDTIWESWFRGEIALSRPVGLHGYVFVESYRGFLIRFRDGAVRHLSSAGPIRFVNGDALLLDWDESGSRCRLNTLDLSREALRPFPADNGQQVIFAEGLCPEMMTRSGRVIELSTDPRWVALDQPEQAHLIDIGDNFIATDFELPKSNPEHDPMAVGDTRYVLVVLSAKEPWASSWQLAILDADNPTVAWRSRRDTGLRPRSHFKVGTRDFLVYGSSSASGGCMLVFDRESGKFTHALRLVEHGRALSTYDMNVLSWQVSGNIVFGVDHGDYWAVDLETRRLIGSSRTGLVLQDGFAQAEADLGPLPR